MTNFFVHICHYSNSNNSTNNNSSTGGGLHCIVLGVLRQVDNLRSAVAKNALITLGDLFQGLGKFMDQEVALALTYVLKVSIHAHINSLFLRIIYRNIRFTKQSETFLCCPKKF